MQNERESKRISGNVLDHLGLDPQDVLELNLKAQLHQHILRLIEKKQLRARELEKILDVPQPRISELMRGKLSLLSVSKLLYYADRLGAYASIKLHTKAA